MATTRMIAREDKRVKRSKKAYVKREALRNIVKDQNADYDEKIKAVTMLNEMSPNDSHIRIRRLCRVCGRPRGVLRKFGLCRLCLRKALMFGLVPGARKASW